jgi:hypothetical protein
MGKPGAVGRLPTIPRRLANGPVPSRKRAGDGLLGLRVDLAPDIRIDHLSQRSGRVKRFDREEEA